MICHTLNYSAAVARRRSADAFAIVFGGAQPNQTKRNEAKPNYCTHRTTQTAREYHKNVIPKSKSIYGNGERWKETEWARKKRNKRTCRPLSSVSQKRNKNEKFQFKAEKNKAKNKIVSTEQKRECKIIIINELLVIVSFVSPFCVSSVAARISFYLCDVNAKYICWGQHAILFIPIRMCISKRQENIRFLFTSLSYAN